VEILHTILLGPVKYLVKKTFNNLSPADKKKLNPRSRHSTFQRFLDVYRVVSLKTMASPCAGRDFKLWAQISVFILEGLISDDELQVWIYLSEV
jgi:hypothetical protein